MPEILTRNGGSDSPFLAHAVIVSSTLSVEMRKDTEMGGEAYQVESSLTASDVLERTAESGVDGAAAITAVSCEHGTANLPSWIDLDSAATILGLSKLHVRLLGRDGKLKMMTTGSGIKVDTSSVMDRLEGCIRSREVFARHAAHQGLLVEQASSAIGA